MSFPFRRLPFLAISEVIQSMDTRSIFFLSMLSRKSANFVMLSIPKNSLSADFTFRRDGFLLELMPAGYFKQGANFLPVATYGTENESLFIRFSTCGLYVQCNWTYTFKAEESSWKLFYCFSKIFINSKFSITFDCNTREEFAMAIMRFAWGNGIPLDRINFFLLDSSSETIQELLNSCNEHHTSLYIGTKLPKGFICTPPPSGYKLNSLTVNYAHWVNLDDFLQCQSFRGGVSGVTVEYLNNFLKKIVNLECRIETFTLLMRDQEPFDFAQMVKGLSESEIEQDGNHQKLQFERKDGLKLLLTLYGKSFLKMTTF